MIVIYFPLKLESDVMQVVGQVQAEDVSLTVKIRGSVGEGIVEKLKKLGCKVIQKAPEVVEEAIKSL